MADPKYICVNSDHLGPVCYIFPAFVSHRDMALLVGGEVLGAGFVKLAAQDTRVYGGSDSLGVKSDPKHARMIQRQYGLTSEWD